MKKVSIVLSIALSILASSASYAADFECKLKKSNDERSEEYKLEKNSVKFSTNSLDKCPQSLGLSIAINFGSASKHTNSKVFHLVDSTKYQNSVSTPEKDYYQKIRICTYGISDVNDKYEYKYLVCEKSDSSRLELSLDDI